MVEKKRGRMTRERRGEREGEEIGEDLRQYFMVVVGKKVG